MFNPKFGGIIIWPIQDDRMNMTKKFENDQKIHTDDHYLLNLTENIINITRIMNMNVWIWPKLIYFSHIHRFVSIVWMIFLLIYFRSYSSIFVSSTVKVRWCNLSVKFQCSRLLVWIFFSHILTHFWSYWLGQNN